MGKLKLWLIAICMMPLALAAQKNSPEKLDETINQFIDQLKAEGFERIGFVRHYCQGYKRIWKEGEKCNFDGNYIQVYVFWDDSTGSYVKKFDNCGTFTMATMSASPFFEFYEDNATSIAADEVKPFEYVQMINGKAEGGKVRSDHSCFRDVTIWFNGEKVSKSFDLFDLKKKDGNQVNLNYAANKSLALVEWDKKISKLIWKVEDRGGFLREFPSNDKTAVSFN